MSSSDKSVKTQRSLRSKQSDSDVQDGGACDCGGPTQWSREIMQGISKMLDEKLAKFTETLEVVATRVESHTKRLDEAEQRVSGVEDVLAGVEKKWKEAEKKIRHLTDKLDDTENRSRRDNIRVVGLQEGIEGRQPVDFFETWLPKVLDLNMKHGRIKLDRAHRNLRPQNSNRPRPVVMKLHNPADKFRILDASKGKRQLIYEGQRVFIQQDFSSAVKERRRSFNKICEQLIERDIRFIMRYPATLCVTHDGARREFHSPAEAQVFMDELKL